MSISMKRRSKIGRSADRFRMHTSFWNFSVKLYASPGVAAECLRLQDEHGVDVNLLMFCAYAALIAGVQLADNSLGELERCVAEIRNGIITPLRECRRRMKDAVANLANGDRGRAEHLRSEVKKLELVAERLEQERLVAWLSAAGLPKVVPGALCLDGNIAQLRAHYGRCNRKVAYPELLRTAALLLAN